VKVFYISWIVPSALYAVALGGTVEHTTSVAILGLVLVCEVYNLVPLPAVNVIGTVR
jgi:hypothetical protein